MAEELALQHLQPLVAELERGRRPHVLLGPLQDQRAVERDRGGELEVVASEGPLVPGAIEIEQPADAMAGQGQAEDGADPQTVDARRGLELRMPAEASLVRTARPLPWTCRRTLWLIGQLAAGPWSAPARLCEASG